MCQPDVTKWLNPSCSAGILPALKVAGLLAGSACYWSFYISCEAGKMPALEFLHLPMFASLDHNCYDMQRSVRPSPFRDA